MNRMLHAAAGRIDLKITLKDDKVISIKLDWNYSGINHNLNGESSELQKKLEAYVSGKKVSWPDFQFDFSGLTPFRKKVLETLYSRIGWGRFTGYGELAELAGSPKAARAVGGAMAANPFPLIIPCHRVIGSNKKLTGFSGPGIEMKKYLLDLEGISWIK